jgi:hypothetical protein
MNEEAKILDAEPEVEETPKATRTPEARISLDTNIKDVIAFDKKGFRLIFESRPGRFKELSEQDVRGLSRDGQRDYLFALLEWQKASKTQPSEGLQVQPERAMAQTRLDFKYSPEFEAKYHPCLKRPDQLSGAKMEGYTVATASDGVEGFGVENEKGTIKVGAAGYDDLVLMKIPRETYEASQRRIEEKSKATASSAAQVGASQIKKSGGKSFLPAEKDGNQWKDVE